MAQPAVEIVLQDPTDTPPAVPPSRNGRDDTNQEARPPAGNNVPGNSTADAPVSQTSSLLGQLSRVQERAAQSAAPSTAGVDATTQTSTIETTQLVRQANSATSIAGVRRSPISIQPVIRGYSQTQIYAQYQGANFVPVRADFDSIVSSIDPGVIDNLLIIPGPYGLKYGPGLAYIDIVATPTPRHETPEFHSRTNLLYQTNGAQFYAREMIYGGGADYGLRVILGQKLGSDYHAGDGTLIPSSYNSRDIDIAVGLDLSEDSQLELEYLTQDLTNTEFAGLIFDCRFRKMDGLFLHYTCDDPTLPVHWLCEAWYNRTIYSGDNLNPSKQFFYRNDFLFNSSPQPFPHVSFVGYSNGELTNAGFRLAPTWGDEGCVQLTTGVDFHFIHQRIDEFDLFEEKSLQISPTGFDNFPVPPATSYDPGFFVELKIPVNDDLKITAGARVDQITSDADDKHRAVAPDGTIPPIVTLDVMQVDSFEEIFGASFYRRDVLLAGFVAADYSLTKELNLRAGFGHGERAPSATERYAYLPFLTVVQTPSNAPLGNPELQPEKSNQFDLSLVGTYDHLRFQASGFCSLVYDYITLRPFSFPSTPSFTSYRYTNTDAILTGCEAAGEYDLAPTWSVFGNLSYVRGEDLIQQSPLPSIYPLQSRAGLSWHDPDRKQYGIEFSALMVAAQNQVDTLLNEPTTPGFGVFFLRGYWQANEHVRVTCGVDNVTNRTYLEALNVHNPPVYEPGVNLYFATQFDY